MLLFSLSLSFSHDFRSLSFSLSRMIFSEISKASFLFALQFQLNKADGINPFYILITCTVITLDL